MIKKFEKDNHYYPSAFLSLEQQEKQKTKFKEFIQGSNQEEFSPSKILKRKHFEIK